MTDRIAVVGSSGRVGHELVSHLSERWSVQCVDRAPGGAIEDTADQIPDDVRVVVNAAGVAHIEQPNDHDLERLREANVELPVALAWSALRRRASMIHVSSVKAASPGESPYARSKAEGEQRLELELAEEFRDAGLSLVVVRPLALLFPPLDAGKVAMLRWTRLLPEWATPPVRLPVLAPATLLGRIEHLVADALEADRHTGFRVDQFDRESRGTLRDVRAAMLRDSDGRR